MTYRPYRMPVWYERLLIFFLFCNWAVIVALIISNVHGRDIRDVFIAQLQRHVAQDRATIDLLEQQLANQSPPPQGSCKGDDARPVLREGL